MPCLDLCRHLGQRDHSAARRSQHGWRSDRWANAQSYGHLVHQDQSVRRRVAARRANCSVAHRVGVGQSGPTPQNHESRSLKSLAVPPEAVQGLTLERVPRPRVTGSTAQLQKQLEQAVESMDYELAASIKRKPDRFCRICFTGCRRGLEEPQEKETTIPPIGCHLDFKLSTRAPACIWCHLPSCKRGRTHHRGNLSQRRHRCLEQDCGGRK